MDKNKKKKENKDNQKRKVGFTSKKKPQSTSSQRGKLF